MSTVTDEVFERALELSEFDRARLASDLLASLDASQGDAVEIERAWSEETNRRMARLDAGESQTISRESVRQGLAEMRTRRSG